MLACVDVRRRFVSKATIDAKKEHDKKRRKEARALKKAEKQRQRQREAHDALRREKGDVRTPRVPAPRHVVHCAAGV